MQQLTAEDASFLYLETPNAPMSGGYLNMYDPSTAPGGRVTFKGILAALEARLHLAPSFRQRLVRVPMDLDHPYWVDDVDFDLEYHVRHIALPHPGDWRQLCIQVARLLARPLDMTRPLWELYVIEGLDNIDWLPKGSYATFLNSHHAAMDGMSGMDLVTAMHDLTCEAEPPAPERPWKPRSAPAPAELLARAGMNNFLMPARLVQLVTRTLPDVAKLQSQLREGELAAPGGSAPRTRFNATISAHRVIDGRHFPLEGLKQIKNETKGATINDAVLAIVGGALRTYLGEHGELPAEALQAMVPISVRTDDQTGAGGNQVSAMVATLGTQIKDPLERLAAIRASTRESKALSSAVGARALAEYSRFMPGGLMIQGARLASQLGLANRTEPPYNTVVTNMPGPQVPLYSAGARLVAMKGCGMIHDAMGLMHVVTSYCGTLAVTFVADREMMSDPAFYAECLQGAYDDLARAAGVDATGPPPPDPPRPSRPVAAKPTTAEPTTAEPTAGRTAAARTSRRAPTRTNPIRGG